jgi:hypothetical protein
MRPGSFKVARSKDPKPYTLKQRRGERPYSYSEQYGNWRRSVMDARAGPGEVRAASAAWSQRFGPDRGFTPRQA